ncbi:hypothetical protein AwEntero_29960 [Enterobacterales bacterium]|nr:hypothetical protein AwEntero_29960 [Enterobacterales bacterium]
MAFTTLNPVWAGAHDLELELELEFKSEFEWQPKMLASLGRHPRRLATPRYKSFRIIT